MKTINNFFEWLLSHENKNRDTAEMFVVMLCIFYFIGQFIRASL